MFARFTDALRGARKAELMIILALAAIMLLAFMARAGDEGSNSDLESRLGIALEKIRGAGEVQVMINQSSQGDVVGVLIIAEGAGDIQVRLEILRAVKTLMGLDADRIEITQMRGD